METVQNRQEFGRLATIHQLVYTIHMSPRVLRLEELNIEVKIHWKERHGPHCHVIAPGAKASFDLQTMECLVSRGFSEVALARIQKALLRYQAFLLEKWDEIQEEAAD